jgi:hypothetical protein
MARRKSETGAKKTFASILLLSFTWQIGYFSPAYSLKKPLSLPVYTQLNQGAGPETHDLPKNGSASGGNGADSVSTPAPVVSVPAIDLTPVKLEPESKVETAVSRAKPKPEANIEKVSVTPPTASVDTVSTGDNSAAQATDDTSGSAVLNATVNKDEFLPKAPVDRTDLVIGEPAKKSSKKDELERETKDLGRKLGPLQLQETDSETDKKTVTVVDAEKAELADLWDAALCRNQDIQFVVQKLMPTKDPKHTTAVMMKMLSTAMYGAMCASSMAMPSGMSGGSMQGMYMAQNAGAGLVMNVLNGAASKSARKAAVTETEAIMLYNIIRSVSEKVVENFHEYKKNRSSVERGYQDYQDLQNMVSEARSGQDSAKQIEMEYTLRKARRDIDAVNDDVRRCRQALVDLSGLESVDKLDKQIAIEMDKVDNATDAVAGEPSGGAQDQIKAAGKDDPTM